MKNRFLIILSLLILLNFIFSVNLITGATTSCNPQIKIVNQDPIPAISDSYLKIVFEASGLENCNGLTVKLNPKYPFSLDPDSNPVQTINQVPFAMGFKSTWNFGYKVRISSDALEGDYRLELFYHDGSNDISDPNFIGKDFNISIVDSQTDFAAVIQEASGNQVSLGIVNTGKNTANSLIVSIPQQDNYRVSGTSDQIVGNLAAGDYTIVSFTIVPGRNQRNATRFNEGQQNLKVQMDYTDGIGKRRIVTKEISFSGATTQNFTQRATGQFNRSSTTSSGSWYTNWIFWVIVGVIILALFFIYIKYKNNIKNLFKKSHSNKNSENAPSWVLSERTHRKK